MRLKLSALLCLIYIMNSVCSQEWLKDTCKLNGNVHFISYFSESSLISKSPVFHKEIQEYNRSGYLVRENRSNSLFGQNFNGYFRLYNEFGNQCKREYFIQDGDTAAVKDFFFNKEGHIVKSTSYVWGEYSNTTNYSYENNRIVRQLCLYNSSDTILKIFNYDKKDRMIIKFHSTGKSEDFTFWKYNKNGLVRKEKYKEYNWTTRTTIYKNANGEKDSIIKENYSENPYVGDSYILKYSYNKNDQLVKKVNQDANGKTIYKSKFEYNTKGNVNKEIITYGLTSKDKRIRTFEYVYDEKGNWIEKVTKINGEIDQRETREITYFSEL